MIGGNLIEIAAGLAAFGTSACLYTSVYALKLLRTLESTTGNDIEGRAAEYGWKFNLAWFLPCLVVPVMFTCVFTEIYESLDITDAATSVLALFWVYLLLMTLWVYAQYIFSTYRWASYLLLIGALVVTGVQTGYVLVTLHSSHWYHWLIVLFYIPPVVAIFANRASNAYRDANAEQVRIVPSLAKANAARGGLMSRV